jgi:hypothetical protein
VRGDPSTIVTISQAQTSDSCSPNCLMIDVDQSTSPLQREAAVYHSILPQAKPTHPLPCQPVPLAVSRKLRYQMMLMWYRSYRVVRDDCNPPVGRGRSSDNVSALSVSACSYLPNPMRRVFSGCSLSSLRQNTPSWARARSLATHRRAGATVPDHEARSRLGRGSWPEQRAPRLETQGSLRKRQILRARAAGRRSRHRHSIVGAATPWRRLTRVSLFRQPLRHCDRPPDPEQIVALQGGVYCRRSYWRT